MKILKCNTLNIWGLVCWAFVVLLLIAQPVMAEEPESDQWTFLAEAYLWGADIGGETAEGADIDIKFSDLIDNLDFAFMGLFGASKSKWTFLVDVIYMDVEDNSNVTVNPLLALTDIELEAWVVTPVAAYEVLDGDRLNLSLLAGARYLWLEADLDFDVGLQPEKLQSSDSGSVWDGIVGVRGDVELTDQWYLPFYLDVGTGDTDMTWQALGGVGYRFSKLDLVLAYRYLEWDFDDDDKGGGTFNDLDLSGPLLGVKFMF